MFLLFLNIKFLSAVLSTSLGFFAYFFYIRGMFRGETKPHLYTWLIWTITLAIAVAGIWYGGGGYALVSLSIAACITFFIFLLSFKYGTRHITKWDTALLLLALTAILVWREFHAPLLSVFMVTAIDALGYIPTFRKSFVEPWSEPMLSWILFTLPTILTISALSNYNLLTTLYLAMSVFLNVLLIAMCLWRRKKIPRPPAH